jgi:cellulose synthase (UDP-forming)
VNCVLLLLVAMLCLQAKVRRGEERFTIDEGVLVLKESGQAIDAPVIDLSVSGAALRIPEDFTLAGDEAVSITIRDVGVVRGRVVRQNDGMAGVTFLLPESIERDLLIRKIFTSGLNTIRHDASTLSVVLGLLKRIFTLDASLTARPAAPEPMVDLPEDTLPAASFVLPPARGAFDPEEAASGRLVLAA